MELTITHLDTTDPTVLHRHYPRDINPQPAFIELDAETGRLRADYVGEPGPPYGMPEGEFHRRLLRWTIPALTPQAANQVMDDLAPLARRVLAGATVEFDGSNRVGRYSNDAHLAMDEIETVCDTATDLDQVEEVDAADWCGGGDDDDLGVTADSTDEDLERVAGELHTSAQGLGAAPANYTVLRGMGDYLEAVRDRYRDAARDELETVAEQLEQLRERRDELIRRTGRWGDSDRTIAACAGLSHTHIATIRRA